MVIDLCYILKSRDPVDNRFVTPTFMKERLVV